MQCQLYKEGKSSDSPLDFLWTINAIYINNCYGTWNSFWKAFLAPMSAEDFKGQQETKDSLHLVISIFRNKDTE